MSAPRPKSPTSRVALTSRVVRAVATGAPWKRRPLSLIVAIALVLTSTVGSIALLPSTALADDAGASAARSTVASEAETLVAGTTTAITVQAKAADGTNRTTGGAVVVITQQSGDSAAVTLSGVTDNEDGTYSATVSATTSGTRTFEATLDGAEVQGGTGSVQIVTVNFIAGAAAELVLTTDAAGAASGAAFTTQPVVEIRDAQGNLTGSTANVTMTVSADGTVVGTATVAAVGGVATFTNVGISGTAADYTLTFASDGLTSDTQTITLGAGAADELVLTTDAAGAASGAAFETQPVVEIRDAQGNLTDSTANVTMTVSVDGTVVGTATVAAVDGVATFTNVGISGTAADYTLTFASGVLTSDTQTITLGAGAADELVLTTDAAGAASGAAFETQPVVEIRDAQGNLTDSTANVTMTVSVDGTVVGTATVAAVGGVATFTNVGISGTAADYTLTFASDGLDSDTQTITLGAGAADELVLTTDAAGAASGAAFETQPVVEIRDAQGNLTDSTANVTMTVSVGWHGCRHGDGRGGRRCGHVHERGDQRHRRRLHPDVRIGRADQRHADHHPGCGCGGCGLVDHRGVSGHRCDSGRRGQFDVDDHGA